MEQLNAKKEQSDDLTVLVVGSGGREDALARKFAMSPRVKRVIVAPGNPGTASRPKVENAPFTSIGALMELAVQKAVAFTVVGPEGPLDAGIVNAFRARELEIFGPTKEATILEARKDFSKPFMDRHKIRTAKWQGFLSAGGAYRYVEEHGVPIVLKDPRLVAGKGAHVCRTLAEARATIDMLFSDTSWPGGEAQVIAENFITGDEASFIVMVDKNGNVLPLATSQDHKQLLDNDEGPMTGGMGANSPAPVITPERHENIMREIIQPAVCGMIKESIPFTGFLYAGLMFGRDGKTYVLEFNARLGDPETQPILMRLKTDLVDLIEHGINGTLDQIKAEWDERAAVGVVLAAHGYPGTPRKGDTIIGIPEETEDCSISQAGTADSGGMLVTNGGRVLCVTALGHGIEAAQSRAYEVARRIQFNGRHVRYDIGDRALGRTRVVGP